eukprot:COSAG02_NODE_1142_length_14267_cov_4.941700_1_plen_81_part_00
MGCGASSPSSSPSSSRAYRVEPLPLAVSASFDDRKAGTFLAPIKQREASVDALIDAAIAEDELLASIDEMEQQLKAADAQ